ncbi:leucine-rich repeat receptor-like protein kinase TDR [Impatiens glandulifera]|uniref:leucine-rich repeat receptor-like protein kinase TDR n=1 Tax=Impatiens glandulifera TaxID=253017 RepID=UPI001FB0E32A|nr:leucine-rich repeat receptor-like protein kinase TDR [Impatiens glandulifera]
MSLSLSLSPQPLPTNHHETTTPAVTTPKSSYHHNHQNISFLKFTPPIPIPLFIIQSNPIQVFSLSLSHTLIHLFPLTMSIASIHLLLLLSLSFLFRFHPAYSSVVSSPQLISLLSLKSSLIHPLDTFHDWNLTTNLSWCSWSGVQCQNNTNQITSLDLSSRNLSGTFPPTIRHLRHLRHLNLSGNAFDGPLQTLLFDLPNLRTLDISRNLFNSTFPPGISRLKYLTYFNAYSNSFTGHLPQELSTLRFLEYLSLSGSYFDGPIPGSLSNLERLTYLNLAGNLLTSSIPDELGFMTQLQRLEIGYNQFDGPIPAGIGNLKNLKYLDIASANLSGELLLEIGNLTMLETLLLHKNHFSGHIPVSYGQLVSLNALDLSDNNLSGPIPEEICSLKELVVLNLMNNLLTGEIPGGIGDLPHLEFLSLWNNSLSGILPRNLGSKSTLQKLDVSTNFLSGPIPSTVCDGNRLEKLVLFGNNFTGEIPPNLANCRSLLRVRIQQNKLNGSIPLGFGLLSNLTYMDLSENSFSGEIPPDFGNAAKLEFLNISGNSFDVELPANIWGAPSLQIFSASYSKINGRIPDFIGCGNLYKIELEGNSLIGSIPWDIDHCLRLILLNLRGNSLSGIIPWEISTLPVITDVDLSHNLLTGTIPSNFNNCSTLESFNVSYNQLTGPIPSSGRIFPNLHPSSFDGNEGLCGGMLKRHCDSAGEIDSNQQPKRTANEIWIVAAGLAIGLFILFVGSRCFYAIYGHRQLSCDRDRGGPWKLTAFQRLNFTADDVLECLTMSDKIIGMGSTGTVYKAEMPNGENIAVKKLWGKQKETTVRRSVLAEVDVLGRVRHRNIVRLLGCCSNSECTMLLYEYMANGSLDDLLHGKNKGENFAADWVTRYKIALGVAQGICYLHHDCDPAIVHRDLKPGNILLDGEMEARVADFGLAKLIQTDESMSVIAGSYGYIAPEYGYTLQVDEKSDIYSYGVVLMEIVTGKRSVDSEFGDGNCIVDWMRSKLKLKKGLMDVLDKKAGALWSPVREEMMLVLRIALLCTSRNPADRPSMRDVVSMLKEAKPKRKSPDDVSHHHVVDEANDIGTHLSQKNTSVVEC